MFIALIWVVELVNSIAEHELNQWGILPRTSRGLIGVPLMPFLHGGVSHVVSNTIPFAVLGGLIAFRGYRTLLLTSLFIIVVGGLGVWLVGRTAFHVGASGLVFGYFGYLLARGWFDRSFISIVVAIAVLVFYGGMIFGVLPLQGFVSWEGHLFGMIAGVLAARFYVYRVSKAAEPSEE